MHFDTQDKVEQPELALVTGANGFVGGHLARMLRASGKQVRVLVRSQAAANSFIKEGFAAVVGDLAEPATLPAALEGVSHVYHIAALFRQAGLPDSSYRKVNAEGTRHMLDSAIAAGVKRFIHCSTVGVLGDVEHPPGNEQTPYSPGDIYQQTKMEGELIALDYFGRGAISGCVIRPAMIYGPGDLRTLKLFKAVAKGRFFYVGPGTALTHFIQVRDLCRAFILAMEHTEVQGGVFIIAGRESLPLNELVKLICSELKVKEPWLHLPVKPMQLLGDLCEAICKPFGINPPIFRRRVDFYVKNRQFDYSKARSQLGFEPEHSLKEEISEIVSWYKEHRML